MRKLAYAAWRAVAVAAALAISIAFTHVDVPTAAHIVVIAAILAAGGALADRFWVAFVPFVAGGGYLVWFAIAGRDLSQDWTWPMAVQVMFVFTSVPALGLLAGVLLRRLAGSGQRRRDHPGRRIAG